MIGWFTRRVTEWRVSPRDRLESGGKSVNFWNYFKVTSSSSHSTKPHQSFKLHKTTILQSLSMALVTLQNSLERKSGQEPPTSKTFKLQTRKTSSRLSLRSGMWDIWMPLLRSMEFQWNLKIWSSLNQIRLGVWGPLWFWSLYWAFVAYLSKSILKWSVEVLKY